ncbi:unnamed protein product [Cuscuta epithymum]|uniref:Uncharacterized protein n=1 Tax=Cuscuta epithymum TaxID=186058 RepID=A0AAV0CGE5_9ASTE|nr:unnamed protein product [Cuscuta epithymum]
MLFLNSPTNEQLEPLRISEFALAASDYISTGISPKCFNQLNSSCIPTSSAHRDVILPGHGLETPAVNWPAEFLRHQPKPHMFARVVASYLFGMNHPRLPPLAPHPGCRDSRRPPASSSGSSSSALLRQWCESRPGCLVDGKIAHHLSQ